MKTRKNIALAAITVCMIVFVSIALFIHLRNHTTNVPDEVTNLIEEYMAAYKKGTKNAIELIHFNDDFKRQAYLDSGDKLVDYEVQSIEKINDNLYALYILIKTETSVFYNGDNFELVYNFAARIDGQWKYINGVANIPENLRENLVESKYTYQDENIVDFEDVIR